MCAKIKSVEIINNTFNSCSTKTNGGGGMCIVSISSCVRISGCEFQNCKANSYGGGLYLGDFQVSGTGCVGEEDGEGGSSYDQRVCHGYIASSSTSWTFQHTEKWDWLSEGMKDRYDGVSENETNNLCGMNESAPCKTVGHTVVSSMGKLITLIAEQGGRQGSEEKTISVGEKKISVVGRGKEVSEIGTSALSSPATTLFSISSSKLETGYEGIDHNATRSTSPSVFMVSDGSGSLSLEDVLISSSTTGGRGISSSVFEVALKQLKMVDVEIKNMKISQPLFAELSSAGSSSGESVLANVTIRNVSRTG
ncbi:putative autophagy-related protein 16 (Atg16) [Monocercomonoides exilis]|uniref:putative autophagy-related protein 16 (Atg16) n=1 Tax=Monocercomonoides exilis TaxID=2049356 RepID=UPI00355A7C92|nr:putative autophagy-related protein 16 (Atg16) [Monocercomonoides exilis]|eukprot:MONOS_11720.1-p1 / transcript=MONOS_11720.1 / gene=MONOS_11720 / organism=Monocercomonoides_exilis_PA203 / gene_product=autophagy-related protein 16 (Atg16) / transcript_product=autophagy-related protein 16 (Atg16) / location=Mono_scaffold00604:28199-29455(+) / protein_length=309 / sequence_SO=supercontig / SO=protein_coding / is_pseudo=false